MNDKSQNSTLIDMWYPSRMDIENCPLDYFVIKYIHGLEPEQMPPPLPAEKLS